MSGSKESALILFSTLIYFEFSVEINVYMFSSEIGIYA